MRSDFGGFETGLYFEAWTDFYVLAHAPQSGASWAIADAQAQEKEAWSAYTRARTKLGVSDAKVMRAADPVGPLQLMIDEEIAKFGDEPR